MSNQTNNNLQAQQKSNQVDDKEYGLPHAIEDVFPNKAKPLRKLWASASGKCTLGALGLGTAIAWLAGMHIPLLSDWISSPLAQTAEVEAKLVPIRKEVGEIKTQLKRMDSDLTEVLLSSLGDRIQRLSDISCTNFDPSLRSEIERLQRMHHLRSGYRYPATRPCKGNP